MRRTTIAGLVALCLILPAGGARAQAPNPPRPNIVIFYLDDVAPHDGRLWSDPTLTPTITDYFVAHGIRFTNAIGETPQCCPGRAGLLTGLHTHNHGVVENDARLFNPREHIGAELKRAGYASMWVGKYLNKNNLLTPDAWRLHGAEWTFLDATLGRVPAYYNYKVHTKSGNVAYADAHSTRMAAERTVERIRSVPLSTPIFSVVSFSNLHGPNVPMVEFESDPRWTTCSQMARWKPPNYNEADTSDKPAHIRQLPLLISPDGWPMDGYCREMLGLDWAVKTVIDELASSGRLSNSLLIFTADNGVAWGAHRLGQSKLTPYSTPVPLYMWWPDRWGDTPRDVDDLVSNIDLAPTLCALAGCKMGPYPTGQGEADGVSLVKLLDGDVGHLARTAVLESAWSGEHPWLGVRTGPDDPLGPWHYVHWASGEHELYDLDADPWELDNLYGQPRVAATQTALAARLAELRLEGVTHRPDVSIAKKFRTRTGFVGDGVYQEQPDVSQTVKRTVNKTDTASFSVRIDNDGGVADTFVVTCTLAGVAGAMVDFTSATPTCLDDAASSTYTITLEAHATSSLPFRLRLPAGSPRGTAANLVVSVRSNADATAHDAVKTVAVR